MDSSSRECVPKLGTGGEKPTGITPRLGAQHRAHFSKTRGLLPTPRLGLLPPTPCFTRGRCPGAAGKCRSQISRRSRSGAGPCCLRQGNEFAVGCWAGRWEWGRRAPSWCETEKRAGSTPKVPVWWPWPRRGPEQSAPGASRPLLNPAAPMVGQQRQTEQKEWQRHGCGGRGRGGGKLSQSEDGQGTAWGGRSGQETSQAGKPGRAQCHGTWSRLGPRSPQRRRGGAHP